MRHHPTIADTPSRPHSLTIAGHRLALLSAAAYEVAFVASEDTIGFAFDAQSGSHAIGSDRQVSFSRPPNSIALTPRGCEVRSASPSGGEYLQVSGDTVTLNDARYLTNISSPDCLPLAAEIRRWFLSSRPPDALQAEALLTRLSNLARRPRPAPKAARWMTPTRYRQVTDLIEAELDTALTIAGIARTIGVSPSFLSRSFRAFCGEPPYDYILSRRVQRARQLISASGKPLAEIAANSGFSSQSHMSTVFKRRLGVTPGELERRCRST